MAVLYPSPTLYPSSSLYPGDDTPSSTGGTATGLEQLVLDGLVLNGGALSLEGSLQIPPPAKRVEMVNSGDQDGSALIRDPLLENREITARVRVEQTATMDLALAQIAGLSKKLQEADVTPGGLPLVWTPAGATSSVTFYVLTGSIDGLPIQADGDDAGWFVRAPVVTIKLTCRPHGYGQAITVTAPSSGAPFLTFTLPSVPGDAPAEGRLTVTEGSGKPRRYVEWGLEQRYYNATTSLLVDSDNLVTSGFAGAQTTRTGAYDANGTGNNVVRATLQPSATTGICGLPALAHIGTFRVKARVFAAAAGLSVRLSWRDGSGPLSPNSYVTPPSLNTFSEIDLGTVTLTPAVLGSQSWGGQIEGVGTGALDIDHLILVPAGEGYGRARGPLITQPGTLVASDTFTAVDTLNGDAAVNGGAWATSGVSPDFEGDGAAASVGVFRTTSDTAPRYAVLPVALAGLHAEVNIDWANATGTQFLIVRWTDASNHVRCLVNVVYGAGDQFGAALYVQKFVGGVYSTIAGGVYLGTWPLAISTRIAADFQPDGSFKVTASGKTLTGSDPVLATGGTLATGAVGIGDQGTKAGTRTFTAFTALSVPAAPPALEASGAVVFTAEGSALTSGGGAYGPSPAYRGDRFTVPAAGDKNLTSRVLVKAARNDLDAGPAEPLGDVITAQARLTPRWIVVGQ